MAENTAVCNRDHSAQDAVLGSLDQSQRGAHRHRCAGCAYEVGYAAGFRAGAQSVLNNLMGKVREFAESLLPGGTPE